MAEENNLQNNLQNEDAGGQPVPETEIETSENDLANKLKECEKKCGEYLSGWQRAKADFQNYKRDEAERLQKAIAFAGEDLMHEMIAVLDSFELGISALEKKGAVDRGIYLIKSQIEDALRRRGLEKIKVGKGDACDHLIMETVSTAESDVEDGRVAEEVSPGYKYGEKVIRPARVIISKKKSEENNK